MVPRIQGKHLLKLAQRQGAASTLPTRPFRPLPCIATPQSRLQSFSTSLFRRQEPRQPPASEPLATEPPQPIDLPSPSPTATTTTTTTTKPKRRLAPRLLLALTFTAVGLTAGSSLRLLLSPPTPPQPGTDEDLYTTHVLREQAAKLPIVQQLTSDPTTWESWDAYESLSPEHRARHITAGALAGSRGVGGYQRVFWNKGSGEMVSVIYFGPATTGWPGVVHGGCLATILDESCGRAAFKEWEGRPGVTANLGLEYKRVTMANGFYVVRCKVREEEELPVEERGKRHYKCWVDATVEDAVTGQVTVVAEALFVGGKGKRKGGFVLGDGGPLGGGKPDEAHARF